MIITNNSNLKMIRLRSKSVNKTWAVYHTCFISINCTLPNRQLPPGITTDHLREYFLNELLLKNVDGIHSIAISWVEMHKKHQCFINLLSEKNAKKAVAFFKQVIIDNIELDSEYRPPNNNNNQMASLNPLLSNYTDMFKTPSLQKASFNGEEEDNKRSVRNHSSSRKLKFT